MSILAPAFFGNGQETSKASPIPAGPRALLILTLVCNTLSNAYSSPVTAFMLQAKWGALVLLALGTIYFLHSRPGPKFPVIMLMPLLSLLVVGFIGIFSSYDPTFTAFSVFTVAGTIVTAYFLSATIIATDSRRAFFDLLATYGRILVVLTAVFAIGGANLGRGAGLTAWSDNPNTLAAFLSPLLVVFLAGCIERRPGWPFWHGVFFIVGFYLVWATNSRASAIWIAISLAGFWLYRRGPGVSVFLVIVALIVLIGWWYPIKYWVIDVLGLNWSARNAGISPLSGREEVWKVGWELFQKKELTGYGLGTSQELIRVQSYKFVRHQGMHFHSSYITMMVELGIFGLVSAMSAIVLTLTRAVAYSGRARFLPREAWPVAALPFALIVGALGHALFESWILAAGNYNMLLFWTWIWMVHHQSQLKIRKVIIREEPDLPMHPGVALAAQ